MQRPPRRTSELGEEPGTVTKSRPSRAQLRFTQTPSTAQKMVSRQSRIAVPSRPPSLERASGSKALLGVPPPSGTRSRGTTPQKTPRGKSPSHTSLLSTAEKQRSGGGVALYNDKKWVQEQTQRITEYLRSHVAPGTIPNIGIEFFERSNCLRQMSIKQFVCIINYFLQLIWGSRFTVGTDHVKDIVNILDKLQYPYPVNKSSLKTPNTQHSFGHVIMLFDFLMDFVPPEPDEYGFFFPLAEPNKQNPNTTEDLDIPDAEFQAQLLLDSAKGFMLWDKDREEEYKDLQQKTCDALLHKCLGVRDTAALDAELVEMESKFEAIKKNCPLIPKKEAEQCKKLQKELSHIRQLTEALTKDYHEEALQLKQLKTKKAAFEKAIKRLEHENSEAELAIRKQVCTVAQRDELMEQAAQLKHQLQSLDRTIRSLQDEDHQGQVALSRIKKQLTDKVEQFNVHLRTIAKSRMDLQLPLNPTRKHLHQLLPLLNQLKIELKTKIEQKTREYHQLQQVIDAVKYEIVSTIETNYNALCASTEALQKTTAKFEESSTEKLQQLDSELQQLDEQLLKLDAEIAQYEQAVEEKKQKVEHMKKDNEEFMLAAEKKHEKRSAAREEFLNKCETKLEEIKAEAQVLEDIVREKEEEITAMKMVMNRK